MPSLPHHREVIYSSVGTGVGGISTELCPGGRDACRYSPSDRAGGSRRISLDNDWVDWRVTEERGGHAHLQRILCRPQPDWVTRMEALSINRMPKVLMGIPPKAPLQSRLRTVTVVGLPYLAQASRSRQHR